MQRPEDTWSTGWWPELERRGSSEREDLPSRTTITAYTVHVEHGMSEMLLDMANPSHIATNTSSIKHMYLSDINWNVRDFPPGCSTPNLHDLQRIGFVQILNPPHENDPEESEPPYRLRCPLHFISSNYWIRSGRPPPSRRPTNRAISSRSAICCIGEDSTTIFPSSCRSAPWNRTRM